MSVNAAPNGIEVPYGRAPSQFANLSLPEGDGPFPVIVFVHGGFWRNTYDLTLAEPLVRDSVARGYATWNIEYRRVGDHGGGYPGTLHDIATAVDHLRFVDAPLDLGRVIVVGHSAGGHLALWVGQRTDPVVEPVLVVGQAPVADFALTANLSNGAVEEFMGGGPEELAGAYAGVDPKRLLPVKVPQLIVHGSADTDVPIETINAYVAAAGSGLTFHQVDGADHFDVIDPGHESWHLVLSAIEERR